MPDAAHMPTAPDERPNPAPTPPLAGITVLDLTRLLPGGYASQMLTDLGADVLKIEEPGLGDYSRTMPPLAQAIGYGFLAVNRGKRSAALNLKHPDGRAALLRLVERADVLLESFRPGTLARLGLSYETLRATNPRLVICSISGYGQDGPYVNRAGHDLNYIGYAGLLAHLRRPGEPPTLPGAQLADIAGGALMAVVGILAALVGRATSGQGRVVDVSMLDGSIALLPFLTTMVLNGLPEPAPGEGWLAGMLPVYRVYETKDGHYVTLGALEPKFWAEFCRRIGRPDLIASHTPKDAAERDRVVAEVQEIMKMRTQAEWVEALGTEDVCLGPVLTLAEALEDDPQVRARGLVQDVDFGPGGQGRAVRLVPRLSEMPADLPGRLPNLGEHTAQALAAAGYSAEEIARLAGEGAIALGKVEQG